MDTPSRSQVPTPPRLVRVLFILVAVTAALSLLYALQFYLGGPIRLAVVSEFSDVAISPSATLIAAGARDGKVRLWTVPGALNTSIGGDFDVAKEAPWPVRVLSGHKAPVIAVAFAPDGATLLSVGSDGEVRRWAAGAAPGSSGEVVLDMDARLAQAVLSADRSLLAVMGEDSLVQIWSVEGAEQVRTLGPTAGGQAIALSDDGTLVAASDGVNLRVWDVGSGAALQTMVGYCEDETYATVDACEDAEETWLGHLDEVTALAFSPDNQLLVSGSTDTTVVFWNVESGEAEWSSVGHWAAVTSLLFDAEGSLVLSTGADNAVKTLRVPGGRSSATFVGSLSCRQRGGLWPDRQHHHHGERRWHAARVGDGQPVRRSTWNGLNSASNRPGARRWPSGCWSADCWAWSACGACASFGCGATCSP